MKDSILHEFYATPDAYTRWLFNENIIAGECFEPCVGDGAIVRASRGVGTGGAPEARWWKTNDLDTRWFSDLHADATSAGAWPSHVDWTITNPPFSLTIEILHHALQYSRVGVAMLLRASIHEVLKEGPRRTFFAEHTPTDILWLPRFAFQRSPKKGEWTTDSMCCCWVVWRKRATAQTIQYAPESVIDELDAETKPYRARMDALMGFTGTEQERKEQRIALAAKHKAQREAA